MADRPDDRQPPQLPLFRLSPRGEARLLAEAWRPGFVGGCLQVSGRVVALVGDDGRLRLSLALDLVDEQDAAVGVASAGHGLPAAPPPGPPDIALVDLTMPAINGVERMRRLCRNDDVRVEVVDTLGDTFTFFALANGHADYPAQPVAVAQLTAQLRALLRHACRPQPEEMPVLRLGDLEIAAEAGEVRLRGTAVPVTRTEFQLICELAGHAGRVLSRQQLLQRVWGYDVGDERLVDVHVARLRRKIEDRPGPPQRLVTVRGMGYKLRP